MSSNWDDFKFKPTEVPTQTVQNEPAVRPGRQLFIDGFMSEMSRSPFFGSGGSLFLGLGPGGHQDNPQSSGRKNPFQSMMKELNDKMAANRGPMLAKLFDVLPDHLKSSIDSFANSQLGTNPGPAVPGTSEVPLTHAERINQLTSYLTNKKLGT